MRRPAEQARAPAPCFMTGIAWVMPVVVLWAEPACAQVAGGGGAAQAESPVPERPAISFNRWQEDGLVAVLAQPDVPIPGTAGHPGDFTGTCEQPRLDRSLSRSTSLALQAVRFGAGAMRRSVEAHDSDCLGAQAAWGW